MFSDYFSKKKNRAIFCIIACMALMASGSFVCAPKVHGAITGSLAFVESGLPAGTSWSVTLVGVSTSSSTSNNITFREPLNTVYSYTIENVPGYTANPPGGSQLLNITGTVTIQIAFSQATSSPTPSESPTPTSTPTSSPTPIPTLAPTPTSTPTPTQNPTPIPTPEQSSTTAPTPTLSPTPTAIQTSPTETNSTSTETPSSEPTPEQTLAPTLTPEPTQSPSILPAITESGATVDIAVTGSIATSQMSNITIVADQTTSKTTISFAITGEAGTIGFGNLTIPKNAVPYGTTPTIYIDSQLCQDQGYTQDAENYYVWYSTHFSNHNLEIIFAAESARSEFPTWIILIIAFVAVLIAAVVFAARKRSRTETN